MTNYRIYTEESVCLQSNYSLGYKIQESNVHGSMNNGHTSANKSSCKAVLSFCHNKESLRGD